MISAFVFVDNLSEGSSSSFIDVERLSSDDEDIRNRILAQGILNLLASIQRSDLIIVHVFNTQAVEFLSLIKYLMQPVNAPSN